MKSNIGRFLPNYSDRFIGQIKAGANDKKLAHFCQKYGEFGYSFIVYPVGGILRYNWSFNGGSEDPPSIHLPDLQMSTETWSRYICCAVSPWIDPDSDGDFASEKSIHQFHQEVEYARYLGVFTILIELKHLHSHKLALCLKKYLDQTDNQITFWILLPTDSQRFGNCCQDIWTIWRNFRTLCGNPELLYVGLSFSDDLNDEFNPENSTKLRRWYAEPLTFAVINYSLFCNENGLMTLTRIHSRLLIKIFSRVEHLILSSHESNLEDIQEKMFIKTIQTLRTHKKTDVRHAYLSKYFDILQIPLQPQSDNLCSNVYQTFERDEPKYKQYQLAIELAYTDLTKSGFTEIILFVLGAGRGPLVTMALNAKNELLKIGTNFLLRIIAVEKNPFAILSLRYCNDEWWDNSVAIIQTDIRKLDSLVNSGYLKRPDIIVSELLGSFGDNELSPECLDGVNSILNKHTICIPQSYRNFIAPISSLRIWQNLTKFGQKNGQNQNNGRNPGQQEEKDRHYVVYPYQICFLNEHKLCFEFSHPNKDCAPNTRATKLIFEMDSQCELMGFIGQFEVILYKNIILSTHPKRHTKDLLSWFPVVFPLRRLYHLENATELIFHLSRNIDQGGCWYEWNIEYKTEHGTMVTSEIQNRNGSSQYMRLN